MKSKNNVLLLSLIAMLLFGCDDFIAEDVSGYTLVVNSPADQVIVPSSKLTFWWDALEVNTAYRLQVVAPSFERTAFLAVDTLISTHRFTMPLDSGQYAWRVRAENGTYRGGFSKPRHFIVTGFVVDGELSGTDGYNHRVETLIE